MKKSHTIVLAAILLMAVGSAFAEVKDPVKTPIIDLGGGTILPAQQLQISLEKLLPDIYYDISCKIIDSNNEKNPVVIGAQTDYVSGAMGRFYLNGQDIGPSYEAAQVKLNQVTNNFLATSLYQFCGSLKFTNADQDDSIVVTCTAAPPQSK